MRRDKMSYLDEKYKKIIEHRGKDNQILKAMEELDELKCSLKLYRLGCATVSDIFGELADVRNMINQLTIIFEFKLVDIITEMQRKTDRELDRIEKEKGER